MDTNAIDKGRAGIPMVVDEKMIKDYLFTSETKLSDKQQNMFMQIAIRHNLDPFKREIYAIAYGKEFSIVTGYQVYIERATMSGKLNGWKCENTEGGAKITIYRKDWDEPFEWEAYYEEFNKGQSSWLKMKKFMIKKVCMGQGFRLAFPTELGNMPYLKEEMEGAVPFANKPKATRTIQEPQAKSQQPPSVEEISRILNEEADEPEHVPEEGNPELTVFRTKIESVSKQKNKADGTPMKSTKYNIVDQFGKKYSTFSATMAGVADKARVAGKQVDIAFDANKYNNISSITMVE